MKRDANQKNTRADIAEGIIGALYGQSIETIEIGV